MKAHFTTIVRGASLLAGASLALTALTVRGAEKAVAADAFPTFESYIKITGQAPSVSGDEKAYQRRFQNSSSGGIGIEDLHFVKEGKDTSTEINAKALTGTEDYLGEVKFSKNEFGSVEAGYKSFRTFYDGVGGFFPLNGYWSPLANRDLHVDRSTLWAEAKIELPNAPVFTLRYANEKREGKKDTTIWGDTDFTGLPNNNPPISQVRKIVPSYIKLDEETQSLEFSVRHTIGNTTAQLTLVGEHTKNFDTRFVSRFPGEARPFPTPASTVLLPPEQMNNDVDITQGDGIDSKSTAAIFKSDTKLNDMVTVKLGARYELLHADLSGDRILVTTTPTATGNVFIQTGNYMGLVGSSRVKEYSFNAAIDLKLTKDLTSTLGIKHEEEWVNSNAGFNVDAASGTPATVVTKTPRLAWEHLTDKATVPELEVCYTGISDLALYGNISTRKGTGVEKNTSAYNPLTATSGTNALMNTDRSHINYTVGGNWKGSSLVNVRAEVFHKEHTNSATGFAAQTGDYFRVASQFTGYKLTVVLHPSDVVSLTSRYIRQNGTMQVTGYLPAFPEYDSCDAVNHTISEQIDWNPSKQFYAQANVNIVFNTINTIYPRAGTVAATSTNIAWDANQVLQDANNNYTTATFLCGTPLSSADDLQFQVNYYKADNDDRALAFRTVTYGAIVEETSATVGLKHKFSDKLVGEAKVGYFDSRNDTTGGNANFHGPQGYVSLTYAL